MATYQSVQSNVSDNTGTVTITKPTSLAVGDYMLAGIMVDRDAGSTASIATLSGWTQLALLDLEGGGRNALGVYSKLADAGDVAASNFTFTGTGSTAAMTMAGYILRITNWGGSSGLTSAVSVASSATLTMTGITPTPAVASSLYVVFAGRVTNSPLTSSVTSAAIATSNPTWTERGEISGNGNTSDTTFAVYTATRTETTATGDYTVTYGNTTNLASGAVAVILHDPINGSLTAPATTGNAYAFTGIAHTTVNAGVDEPDTDIRTYTGWANETKPNTEWTNENI